VQRLYGPETGRILVDGIDLTVADVAWLRRQTGSVLRESALFNRSIRDNIALVDPGMTMDRVIAAANLQGRMNSFSDFQTATTLSSASEG
jgi:subfamily B ATP-binding cassette protein HlyB/CyaB